MKKSLLIATILMFVLPIGKLFAQEIIVRGDVLNIGTNNTVPESSELRSAAIGFNNKVESNQGVAMGANNILNPVSGNSMALGEYHLVTGSKSFTVGSHNTIENDYAMAIGGRLKASKMGSMVIGYGILSGNGVVFENPYPCSLMIGFSSMNPTLFISQSPNNYSDGVWDKTGRIAIGDVPNEELSAKLHIRSDEGEDAGIILEPKDLENSNTFIQLRDENHGISVDNAGHMSISSMNGDDLSCLTLNGKVGVNIENTYEGLNYAFAVSGGILADKVFIQQVDQWHDAVFSTDYKLMSLNDLKLFVQANHHLPEVPAESEVLEQGYDMAEMQGILLKKIEELTLYTIKQQEIIEQLQQRVDELENRK